MEKNESSWYTNWQIKLFTCKQKDNCEINIPHSDINGILKIRCVIQNNTENMKIKSYKLKIKTIKFCPCLTPCQSSMSKGHNLGYDFGSISFRAISISYFISSVGFSITAS